MAKHEDRAVTKASQRSDFADDWRRAERAGPGSDRAGAPVSMVDKDASPVDDDAMSAPPASDWSALMARAQDGDGASYARLLTEITPYLRSLAARRLPGSAAVEDAVQDVLLQIHALRHTYDPRRPFGPWLVTIAKRRIIDRFRREARTSRRETALGPEHETSSADPTNLYEVTASMPALHAAIDRLPPGQREAIRLLKLEEMSLKEASHTSHLSVTALKVATHRGLRSLRRMLAEGDD